MPVLVFRQSAEPRLDLAALLRQAARYFEAEVDVLSESPPAGAWPTDSVHRAELSLRSARYGYTGRFTVVTRAVTPEDLAHARAAEHRGQAAGMSDLAARCKTVLEVHPADDAATEAAPAAPTYNLCALLASVALGPVMPSDHSTLFGVRGAMQRVERALQSG